jgi:hypothetical protein
LSSLDSSSLPLDTVYSYANNGGCRHTVMHMWRPPAGLHVCLRHSCWESRDMRSSARNLNPAVWYTCALSCLRGMLLSRTCLIKSLLAHPLWCLLQARVSMCMCWTLAYGPATASSAGRMARPVPWLAMML